MGTQVWGHVPSSEATVHHSADRGDSQQEPHLSSRRLKVHGARSTGSRGHLCPARSSGSQQPSASCLGVPGCPLDGTSCGAAWDSLLPSEVTPVSSTAPQVVLMAAGCVRRAWTRADGCPSLQGLCCIRHEDRHIPWPPTRLPGAPALSLCTPLHPLPLGLPHHAGASCRPYPGGRPARRHGGVSGVSTASRLRAGVGRCGEMWGWPSLASLRPGGVPIASRPHPPPRGRRQATGRPSLVFPETPQDSIPSGRQAFPVGQDPAGARTLHPVCLAAAISAQSQGGFPRTSSIRWAEQLRALSTQVQAGGSQEAGPADPVVPAPQPVAVTVAAL